ncbi:MAG: heavy metal-associated domain-containing protein [Candidatus Didemnitutus sp.]|nr:heavy metal-associated domain-containing protein [Candidatus Didemnitutus sp.]
MKKLIVTVALALSSFFLVTASAVEEAGPTHVFIQVAGLSCPFCVQGLEKHLKKLDAVAGVTTSLKNGEAVLHLKPGRAVGEKELREAVKKAGFTAGQIRFDAKPAPEGGEKSDPEEKK